MKKGPRALLEIDGEKLISRQIKSLHRTFPYAEFITVLGYGMDAICDFIPSFVRCIENENYENTNVSRSLAIGLKATTTSKVLVIYGDMVFTRATFTLPDKSSIFLDKKGKNDSVGVNLENNKVVHLSYASKVKWGHSFFLCDRELSLMKKLCYNRENNKHYGHEIINMSIDLGAEFWAVNTMGPLIELDTLSDIIKLRLCEEKI